MTSALRRTVEPHGRLGAVEYAGRKYRAPKLRLLAGAAVIVQPVNHTTALVQCFHAVTFRAICYAQNSNLWKRLPTNRRLEIMREIYEHGALKFTKPTESQVVS